MAAPAPPLQLSPRVRKRYLMRDERPVISTRAHWATLVEPVATALAALTLTLTVAVRSTLSDTVVVLFWVFAALVLRALWRWWNWRVEWFVTTDKRLLRTYGIITQRVAMMPLAKVTDLSYDRSVLGRLLGYGEFVLESAGQDQALRDITFIPQPDEKYREIVATIFGTSDPAEDGPDRDADGRRGGTAPAQAAPSAHHWEGVERHELPHDWDWVEDDRWRARHEGREVAVDPDPTPWQ
ncbi:MULTISPECIES: PH domain-containing protein [unclassified Ornithinimicrobium]|uniref:PH domain-containing protein n=1 Tax=unclassified Ornithinimicrobium TaxID=2615080 RepID=UPI003853D5AA